MFLESNYFNSLVELTDERVAHILSGHPEFGSELTQMLEQTVGTPDQVRTSRRLGTARLMCRWYDDFKDGKWVVAVVVTDMPSQRRWIVTAYVTSRLTSGEIEWARS
jgi:hypothetical protein